MATKEGNQAAPPAATVVDERERYHAGRIRNLEQQLAEEKARLDQYRRNVAAGLLDRGEQSRADYLAERRAATQARQQEEREFQARAKAEAEARERREQDQRKEYERFLKRQYS